MSTNNQIVRLTSVLSTAIKILRGIVSSAIQGVYVSMRRRGALDWVVGNKNSLTNF